MRRSLPNGAGIGTNPEQLFAAGYSACFPSAIKLVAGKRKIGLPSGAAIDAEVDLGLAAERQPARPGPAKGAIRYRLLGEGEYGRSEHVIQALLKENGAADLDESTVHIAADGPEAPPGTDVRSPKTYAGYALTENFASAQAMAPDSRSTYSLPAQLALDSWGFGGLWRTGGESTRLETAPGRIVFRFHSRDLHMVLGPAKNAMPVCFRVKLNNAAPSDDLGPDSDHDGAGEARRQRMYQLIRQKGPIKDATFEIGFLDPGVEVLSLRAAASGVCRTFRAASTGASVPPRWINPQRGRVDAISQSAAVLWAIGKHVTEMAVRIYRSHIGADHALGDVPHLVDIRRFNGLGEARPPAPGVEFLGRGEQRLADTIST